MGKFRLGLLCSFFISNEVTFKSSKISCLILKLVKFIFGLIFVIVILISVLISTKSSFYLYSYLIISFQRISYLYVLNLNYMPYLILYPWLLTKQ